MVNDNLGAGKLDLEGVEDDFLGGLDNLSVDAVGRWQCASAIRSSLGANCRREEGSRVDIRHCTLVGPVLEFKVSKGDIVVRGFHIIG